MEKETSRNVRRRVQVMQDNAYNCNSCDVSVASLSEFTMHVGSEAHERARGERNDEPEEGAAMFKLLHAWENGN